MNSVSTGFIKESIQDVFMILVNGDWSEIIGFDSRYFQDFLSCSESKCDTVNHYLLAVDSIIVYHHSCVTHFTGIFKGTKLGIWLWYL